MNATQKIERINATAQLLSKGYNKINEYGQVNTCYCDVCPTIRFEDGKYLVNDSTGQADTEEFDTPEAAVESALLWFASCCLEYTVTDVEDEDAADFVAIALGDRGEAWDRFRGFETESAE